MAVNLAETENDLQRQLQNFYQINIQYNILSIIDKIQSMTFSKEWKKMQAE